MTTDNCVIFKGTKEGISILLDASAEYSTIKEQLEKKVKDSSKFFEGVKTSILFKGKELTEEQEFELLDIISTKTNMNITFFKTETSDTTVKKHKTHADLLKNLEHYNNTKFFKGAVRSGQSMEYDGSIVIIGDVNPGGVVRAGGNIIILGALKGIAHAGCNGMTDAFVSALSMIPVQLRIADIITRFPDDDRTPTRIAEYAYIEDGQIFVIPLG